MATLSTAAKNAALDALAAGSVNAFFFTGTGFATGYHSLTWSSASGGQVALAAATVFSQLGSTGTIVTMRLDTSAFVQNMLLTVGGPGSGEDIEMSPSADVTTNMRIRINSLTLSIP